MTEMGIYFKSSIGRKQIVAVTGLLLIGFLVGHLLGNLTIFLGPDAYNAYAKKLTNLRPGLYVVEFGLAYIFLVHAWFTTLLVLDNIKARGTKYFVNNPKGQRSLSTKLMPFTGTILFAFVVKHLLDFTFADHHGPVSILADGVDYGLYGLVYNTLSNPLDSAFYVIAMCCVGFHLTHGIQSVVQTFGLGEDKCKGCLKKIGVLVGLGFAVAYSLIPISIYLGCLNY